MSGKGNKHRAEIPDEPITAGMDWKPRDRTGAITKRDGYTYRHVRADNVEALKASGWAVDTSQDSLLKNMVVMLIPNERMEARARHYKAITREQMDSVKPESQAAKVGPTAFVPEADAEDRV